MYNNLTKESLCIRLIIILFDFCKIPHVYENLLVKLTLLIYESKQINIAKELKYQI